MNTTTYLQAQLPQLLADLAAMVNTDCGTHNKAGVDAIGRMMREKFSSLGCTITNLPVEQYGDCLLGTMRGRGQARILMLAHLDTVFPDGTAAARPFRLENAYAYGPGVSDMKAGLLAGFYALKAIHESGFNDFAEIGLFCNSEEEVGSPVSRHLYRDAAQRADAVLVLEGARPNGDIVSARKGIGQYFLEVTGKAAHAGAEPERGVSAILELAHKTIALHGLNGMRPGINVNVGVVEGGIRPNVIAEQARAEIDMRVVTRADIAPVEQALREIAARATVAGTHATLSGNIQNPPMEKTRATAFLAELAQRAARRVGFEVRDAMSGGGSDGNFCAEAGTPVLDGLGPVGGADHSPDEYLEVDSIVPRTTMLVELVQLIAREREALRKLR